MRSSIVSSGITLAAILAGMLLGGGSAVAAEETISAVPFTQVHIDDGFWQPRVETNRTVTVPYDFEKCEETGRISNFAKAGGLQEGGFEGIFFNDSDLYKVIEGAAYTLQQHPDPELEAYVDGVIDKIASAQWEDGYLYTFYSLPEKQPQKRWTDCASKHELYCAGHFFEAAAAYYQATGKRKILDVAIRLADYIDSVFGPGKKYDVPGHEEIEIGLVRLYQVTGDQKYLHLSKFFLDQRGNQEHRERLYGAYCQDHQPITEQSQAVGHAVRAGYLYAGMADVAALTGDQGYVRALNRIWNDVVQTKLYLTGGIGARHGGEAFGEAYELPNASAYNETCAAIANALWNHRLFLMHGNADYIDVLERVIYNGFLSGISMSGDRFFYPNPLASDGNYQRSPWFGCSCCPVNVVRFVPSIANYIYAADPETLYVNLFIGGTGKARVGANTVDIAQKTDYPWRGEVTFQVYPNRIEPFTLAIRIPGWARNKPVPSDLYRYQQDAVDAPVIQINGTDVEYTVENGYARLHRIWNWGDTVELDLPMPIRRVLAHPNVEDDRGRVALERGPIVYCLEGVDNGGRISNLLLRDESILRFDFRPDLLNGVGVITGQAEGLARTEDGKGVVRASRTIQAIPYYAWAHRGPSPMTVWIPREEQAAEPLPAPTLAGESKVSASHVWEMDTLAGLNDQKEPENSIDHGIPRMTWWDHRGTEEWVQYDFAAPAKVSAVEVYWFDDTGRGSCRVPESWRLLYRKDGQWQAVQNKDPYETNKDQYNRVIFESVKTDGLRLVVQLQPDVSGGILEWKVQ